MLAISKEYSCVREIQLTELRCLKGASQVVLKLWTLLNKRQVLKRGKMLLQINFQPTLSKIFEKLECQNKLFKSHSFISQFCSTVRGLSLSKAKSDQGPS